MKYTTTLLIIAAVFGKIQAQTVISGKVSNSNNKPLNAASVSIKESGKGVTTDSSGNYVLTSFEKSKKTLEVSSVEYPSGQKRSIKHFKKLK